MDIYEASEAVKLLYRDNKKSEHVWDEALKRFDDAFDTEMDVKTLEKCALDDRNWELHVGGRLALLRKAKSLGANSKKFLMDYYGYLAAYLDPSPEQANADAELSKLLAS